MNSLEDRTQAGGRHESPSPSDVARGMLQAVIVALANSGLMTSSDAEHLIKLLELSDA